MRFRRRRTGRRHKQAVSNVISNMMMIAITLSLAAILIAWTGSTYGIFTGGAQVYFTQRGQAMQERLVVEDAFFNREALPPTLWIFVRNVGAQQISIVAVYINGTTPVLIPSQSCATSLPVTVPVGGVCRLTFSWPQAWNQGALFYIIVATARGNRATFTVRG